MELEFAPFDLSAALGGVVTLVKERAGRRGLSLELTMEPELGMVVADERKISRSC